MSATRPIIDAVVEHLQAAIPWVSVEAFPERPSETTRSEERRVGKECRSR